MAERHWHIKNCDLFEKLTPEQFLTLEQSARVRKFAKGQPVYLPSDASNCVFLLAAGRVKLTSITPDGKQAILAFIEPGEIFGEMALLAQAEREEYAEAMSASTIVLLEKQALENVINQSPHLALGVTKLIGLRRQRIERRLRSLLFRSNRDRLIQFLLELADRYGEATPAGLHLAIPLSHQDIASVIGTTRETVTHLLGELQLARMLKVARQKIVVTDPAKLAAELDVRLPAPYGMAPPPSPADAKSSSPLSKTPSNW